MAFQIQANNKDCQVITMLALNCSFFLLGVVVLGQGIHRLTTDEVSQYTKIFGRPNVKPAYSASMIASGCFGIVVGVLGCVGLLLKNNYVVLLYSILLVLVFIINIVSAVLVPSAQSSVESMILSDIRETVVVNYGLDTSEQGLKFTASIDNYQANYTCCGWSGTSGANLFVLTPWFRNVNLLKNGGSTQYMFPESCCTKQARDASIDRCQNAINDKEARDTGFIHPHDCLAKLTGRNHLMYFRLFEHITFIILLAVCIFLVVQLILRSLKLSSLSEAGLRRGRPTSGGVSHQQPVAKKDVKK